MEDKTVLVIIVGLFVSVSGFCVAYILTGIRDSIKELSKELKHVSDESERFRSQVMLELLTKQGQIDEVRNSLKRHEQSLKELQKRQ